MSLEGLEGESGDCTSCSLKTLSERGVKEVLTMVKNLEEVKDVGKTVTIMS